MTPNVSDFDDKTTMTASPPKPVSTVLQHNYSNIHQPIPRCSISKNEILRTKHPKSDRFLHLK